MEATLRCGAWASHCSGFSCGRAWALGTRASVVVARGLSSCGTRALERRLSSCGARASLLRGIYLVLYQRSLPNPAPGQGSSAGVLVFGEYTKISQDVYGHD